MAAVFIHLKPDTLDQCRHYYLIILYLVHSLLEIAYEINKEINMKFSVQANLLLHTCNFENHSGYI